MSKSDFNALAIAVAAFSAILLFWAVVLLLAIFGTYGPRHMAAASAPQLISAVTIVVSVLSGGAMGAIITTVATTYREHRREREQRKREFRGYLAELRSRVERVPHTAEKVPELFSSYVSLIHQFHRERAKVSEDFFPKDEFVSKCRQLGELRFEDIAEQKSRIPRDVIAEAIDELIRFTKTA